MPNILPDPSGLDIQNVIYSYKIQKETGEWVTVHVQNENANATGYIFRETDEWKPGSVAGTGISKAVPVGNLPRALWGEGSIDVDGNGSVYDASIVYTYRVDPCFNPQFNTNCPGYVEPIPDIPEVGLEDVYDVFDDDNVNMERNKTIEQDKINKAKAKEEDEEEEEERKRRYRLEKVLSDLQASQLLAENSIIEQMNNNMQNEINKTYLVMKIPGGEYKDSVVLADSKLPDSKNGLRNGLAQQLLHNQMVEMQYQINEEN
ncbi:MAG TPA: hypothetical protein DCW83_10280 [Saprospirales bacterium]|nr:hypothetical protein [Saprospirales bacterium]